MVVQKTDNVVGMTMSDTCAQSKAAEYQEGAEGFYIQIYMMNDFRHEIAATGDASKFK